MPTSTLTKAAATRLTQSLSNELPPLPFPIDWSVLSEDLVRSIRSGEHPELLTEQQQEANKLHVALWIVERGIKTFNIGYWHFLPINYCLIELETFEEANHCNTTHCIGGFAQVMSGPAAFNFHAAAVGHLTLGWEAYSYFYQANDLALEYLRQVIARNS